MKKIDLVLQKHDIKIGETCKTIEPNITEDSIFYENNIPIGFYIKNIYNYSEKAAKLSDLANSEFRSKNVPKQVMNRSGGEMGRSEKVKQYSTIIGSIPPRHNMKRHYNSISSVHLEKKAQVFIKAMIMLANESEKIIKEIVPELWEKQNNIFKNHVLEKWRFGNIWTSSISNYNISANYHKDTGNIKDCVNVIIAKRSGASGGHTTVPDYGVTVNSCDNSMLVYPAWKNVHGVTPIIPLVEGGYRNTLIFYPLKAFINK